MFFFLVMLAVDSQWLDPLIYKEFQNGDILIFITFLFTYYLKYYAMKRICPNTVWLPRSTISIGKAGYKLDHFIC